MPIIHHVGPQQGDAFLLVGTMKGDFGRTWTNPEQANINSQVRRSCCSRQSVEARDDG
jgi:hypothetical protein